MSVLLGLLFVLCAGSCWYAADRGFLLVERLAKVAALGALLALAVSLGATDAPGGRALLVALALGWVGDIALLWRGPSAFLVGLGAFLLGHGAYVVASAPRWFHPIPFVLAALLVAPFAVRSLPRIRRGALATGGPRLGSATLLYGAALAAMALAVAATGRPLALLGGFLFVLSDTVLGLDRFDAPRARAPLAILPSYHLAQFFLVLGLLT